MLNIELSRWNNEVTKYGVFVNMDVPPRIGEFMCIHNGTFKNKESGLQFSDVKFDPIVGFATFRVMEVKHILRGTQHVISVYIDPISIDDEAH